MITYVTGVPGGGKSYYGVNYLYNNFAKYDYIYTNLNLKKDNKVFEFYEFKIDILQKHLVKIKEIYDKNGSNKDDLIVNYLKENKLYNSIFVIDEAHNIFDDKNKNNELLMFLLTYHRHLHLDLILITQNLDLIYYKYLKLAETYVVAQRQTLSITNKFLTYFFYSDYKLTQKYDTKKIVKDKKIYGLYVSGDFVTGKKVINKYFKYLLILIFVVVFFVYTAINSIFNKDTTTNTTTNTVTNINKTSSISKFVENDEEDMYVNIRCYNINNTYANCNYLSNVKIELDFYNTIQVFNYLNVKKVSNKYSTVNNLETFDYVTYLKAQDVKKYLPAIYNYIKQQQVVIKNEKEQQPLIKLF